MISTFLGAAHFENGVLSIEPNSRNLIIYADNTPRDDAISVRGPYTIDSAIENESNIIRMPSDAMMTLGIKANDTIVIDDVKYTIEETRDGEPDILRLPKEARKFLDVDIGNVIQNSRLKEIFEGSVITHSFENENQSFEEQFIVSSKDKPADIFEVVVDNVSVGTSRGIFKNSSDYHITINNEEFTSINRLKSTDFTYEGHKVKIMFNKTNSTSIKQYVSNDQGNFLNLNLD
jgi:hypothetical protein